MAVIYLNSDLSEKGTKMKKIKAFEPWVFIFFGIFHLHRIWGLIDRKSYANFWLGIMEKAHFIMCLWEFLQGFAYAEW